MAGSDLAGPRLGDGHGHGYWICPDCGAPQSEAFRCCVECGGSGPGNGAGRDPLARSLTWFLACVVAVLASVWISLAIDSGVVWR